MSKRDRLARQWGNGNRAFLAPQTVHIATLAHGLRVGPSWQLFSFKVFFSLNKDVRTDLFCYIGVLDAPHKLERIII